MIKRTVILLSLTFSVSAFAGDSLRDVAKSVHASSQGKLITVQRNGCTGANDVSYSFTVDGQDAQMRAANELCDLSKPTSPIQYSGGLYSILCIAK